MNYWKAKSDLAFMVGFQADVTEMWERADAYTNRRAQNPVYMRARLKAEDDLDYQAIRTRIAKGMKHAQAIATRLNVRI